MKTWQGSSSHAPMLDTTVAELGSRTCIGDSRPCRHGWSSCSGHQAFSRWAGWVGAGFWPPCGLVLLLGASFAAVLQYWRHVTKAAAVFNTSNPLFPRGSELLSSTAPHLPPQPLEWNCQGWFLFLVRPCLQAAGLPPGQWLDAVCPIHSTPKHRHWFKKGSC